MKWIGISGSWRKTSQKVEEDVRRVVKGLMIQGDGVVTGGALNVDYFATDESLKIDPKAEHIKVFLPITLELYAAHYRKRAEEEEITHQQAAELITQLETLKQVNPDALIENSQQKEVTKETYYLRNQEVIHASDELIAFQVNSSEGVQDTVEKAEEKGIPIQVYSYIID
jgi:hypothetical protein